MVLVCLPCLFERQESTYSFLGAVCYFLWLLHDHLQYKTYWLANHYVLFVLDNSENKRDTLVSDLSTFIWTSLPQDRLVRQPCNREGEEKAVKCIKNTAPLRTARISISSNLGYCSLSHDLNVPIMETEVGSLSVQKPLRRSEISLSGTRADCFNRPLLTVPAGCSKCLIWWCFAIICS